VYAAGLGSVTMIDLLLDDFGVDVDALVDPAVCLDCDPMRVVEFCDAGHGIGCETALMSACMGGQVAAVEALCSRGASTNVQNEVCVVRVGVPWLSLLGL
jgi:hypothetical protein